MIDQEKEAAELAVRWLQNQIEQHGETIILEMIKDRSMVDLDGHSHGLLGCLNFLLGWGRYRVAAIVDCDEKGNPERLCSVEVVNYIKRQSNVNTFLARAVITKAKKEP